MSATEDVARMLTLVPWLIERPGASLEEVSEQFGVPVRTIQRDLNALDFCGLPGLGGGDLFEVNIVGDRVTVQMADELRRPLRLTPREALRLVLTVDAVADALEDEIPALRSAVDAVREAVGVPEGVRVQVEADGRDRLAPIRQALSDGRRLQLAYQGRSDATPQAREVDPWGLHVAGGSWYLQGFDHSAADRRTFRLDRIAELSVMDEAITEPAPEGPLPAPRYAPGADDVEVELILDRAGRWLAESVDDADVSELADGRLGVVFLTDALPWVERLVLMGAGAVEVVRPAELADAVASTAARALTRYR